MSVVLTSTTTIAPNGIINTNVATALATLASDGTPVGIISNNPQPTWFNEFFSSTKVVFRQHNKRQDGTIIPILSKLNSIPTHDFVVLGATIDDVQMAKNGGAVLVPAGWAASQEVTKYGIAVANEVEFSEAISLINEWPGSWYFEGSKPKYAVRSLCNVSGKNVPYDQEQFSKKVVVTIKGGGARLQALLVVAARSLLMSAIATQNNLMWGVYPSSTSTSANADTETLSDFSHRLRTVVSRVTFAKRNAPLFIRHAASIKRSSGKATNRIDPANQIETLHLNPVYKGKVAGRNVVLLDDCTTYGTSFGVASAYLRKAGAASVSCLALGKFGDQLHYYDIDIKTDPFAPVTKQQYTVLNTCYFGGSHNHAAQLALRGLIK